MSRGRSNKRTGRLATRLRIFAASVLTLTLGGCQLLPPELTNCLPKLSDPLPWEKSPEAPKSIGIDVTVYQRAETERADWLEREVA